MLKDILFNKSKKFDKNIIVSEEEIVSLVKRARELDDQEAFSELGMHLSYYISVFEKKYNIPGSDNDEIRQECLVALWQKAIEDFDPSRGKFKAFAVLCIKRHLFSIIKGNNQQKRKALNKSISLDQDRSDGEENLSLGNLLAEDCLAVDEQYEKDENYSEIENKLISKLSPLENAVYKLYVKQYKYSEIVEKLKGKIPGVKVNKKAIDNALFRVRQKSRKISSEINWLDKQ